MDPDDVFFKSVAEQEPLLALGQHIETWNIGVVGDSECRTIGYTCNAENNSFLGSQQEPFTSLPQTPRRVDSLKFISSSLGF